MKLRHTGIRRLSIVLAGTGLLAVVSTTAMLIEQGATARRVLALALSATFLGVNLVFSIVKPRDWMAGVQAIQLLVIAVISMALSDPSDYGASVLFGVCAVLLLKHQVLRTNTSFAGVMGAVVVAFVIYHAIASPSAWSGAVATAAVALGTTAIVYLAFYEELVLAVRQSNRMRERFSEVKRHLRATEERIGELERMRDEALRRAEKAAEEAAVLRDRLVQFRNPSDKADLKTYHLSEREKQVLYELVTNLSSNPVIAQRLGIKVTTVKAHIYSICNKTGLDNRLELIDRFHWHWK